MVVVLVVATIIRRRRKIHGLISSTYLHIFECCFRFYISNGAVVDVLGGDLMATPLHWAVRHGHLEMVVLLIKYGFVTFFLDAASVCLCC